MTVRWKGVCRAMTRKDSVDRTCMKGWTFPISRKSYILHKSTEEIKMWKWSTVHGYFAKWICMGKINLEIKKMWHNLHISMVDIKARSRSMTDIHSVDWRCADKRNFWNMKNWLKGPHDQGYIFDGDKIYGPKSFCWINMHEKNHRDPQHNWLERKENQRLRSMVIKIYDGG